MKRDALIMIAAAGLVALAAGCTQREVVYVPQQQPGAPAPGPGGPPPDMGPVPTTAVVAQAPPAPQVEVIPVAPGAGYVWAPGYWYWGPGGYVWARGHYVVRPYGRTVWVGPRYVRRGGGYVWVGGYWR